MVIMSEEKSSPIGIIIIVFVVTVFVGCQSNNYPETANKNEQQAAKPAEPAKPEAPVFDPNKGGHRDIEEGIRRELNKPGGEISGEDMTKLSRFDITSAQVSDLSPIKAAINIEHLTIRKNQISDLSLLAGMKKLKSLNAYGNRIAD